MDGKAGEASADREVKVANLAMTALLEEWVRQGLRVLEVILGRKVSEVWMVLTVRWALKVPKALLEKKVCLGRKASQGQWGNLACQVSEDRAERKDYLAHRESKASWDRQVQMALMDSRVRQAPQAYQVQRGWKAQKEHQVSLVRLVVEADQDRRERMEYQV